MAISSRRQSSGPGLQIAGIVLVIVIGLVVWMALAVQAAIVGDRQDKQNEQLRKEIAGTAAAVPASTASAQSFSMEASAQAKAAAYDAALPPASLAPVKEITLTATDNSVFGIAEDANFTGWTFGGVVPARPLRVRQGDTVKFALVNNGAVGHSMDFHAASINPGTAFTTVLPGQSLSFEWKATAPGVFMFHCGTAPVLEHIGNGMYGAIIVDPAEGLSPAREYALVQSEFYLGEQKAGAHSGDLNKMLHGNPDYVVFNGMANQYREHPLLADPGERIRLWVVNAGPSQTSAFHVIGVVFDAVYPDGNLANKQVGVSTYNVPAGGAAMFEFTIPAEGTYPFVTHSFADASKGALGVIQVGNPPASASGGHDMTPPAASAVKLDVAGTDNKFTPKDLTAKAGEATAVQFVNKGSAIHNLRIIGMPSDGGRDAQTELLAGGKSGTVTFTAAKAGTYKLICDVHPIEMTGTLTVK